MNIGKMTLTSSELLVVSLIVASLAGNTFAKLDIQKIYRAHAECNGETVSLPVEWMPQGLVAAAQCADVEDEYCAKQCIAATYPGVMKHGRLDFVWLRKESKKLKLSKKNQRAREELLRGAEKCAKPLPRLGRPNGSENCPEAQKFEECMEEEFKYSCKGKKRPPPKAGDTTFLDIKDDGDD